MPKPKKAIRNYFITIGYNGTDDSAVENFSPDELFKRVESTFPSGNLPEIGFSKERGEKLGKWHWHIHFFFDHPIAVENSTFKYLCQLQKDPSVVWEHRKEDSIACYVRERNYVAKDLNKYPGHIFGIYPEVNLV